MKFGGKAAAVAALLITLTIARSDARQLKGGDDATVAAPWFCHDIDCPNFSTEQTYNVDDKEIDLRSYESGKWVSTNVSDVQYTKATGIGFMRLFAYISGANVGEEKIEMTAPVKVLVTPGEGPFCESHFTVSFFVPFDHQDAPPEPTNPDVFLETAPAQKFYVYSYGGYTSESKMLEEAGKALAMLDQLGLEYDASTFYSSGYDSPFRLLNRHNEVWIPTKEAI